MAVDDTAHHARFFGRAVAAVRSELGLKRMDLKERSGLSYPYIAEIENGGKYPSQQAIQKLADALEVQPSELLARAEQLQGSGALTSPGAARPSTASVTPSSPTPDGQHVEDAVSRISDEVFAALEPRIREWLRMEIRMAVQRELQGREGLQ